MSLSIDFVLIMIMIIGSGFMVYADDFKMANTLVPVIAFLIPCQDLLNEGLYTLRSSFKTRLYAYCSSCIAIFLVIGRIIGARNGGTMGVILSRIIVNGCGAVLLYLYTRHFYGEVSKGDKLDKEEKKAIRKYSFQYMITNGLWSLFMLNDVLILGMFSQNSSSVADYKVAYVLPAAISIFSSSIGLFVAPYFTKHEDDKAWIQIYFIKAYICTAVLVGFVALIMGCFARPLIIALYGNNYENIVGLMRVLLIAAFFNAGLRFTTANLLSAMNKIKYNMIISLFGMILQIVMDLVFVKRWTAYGVAFSNCIVYLFMAISLFAIFIKEYYIEKN